MPTIKEIKTQFYKIYTSLPDWVIPVCIVVFFRILLYLTLISYKLCPDSPGYINFSFKDMLKLNFSSGRTPVYPLIIRLCYFIFGEASYINYVVKLQGVFSCISVIFFYKACNIIIKNTKIVFLGTLLYGLSTAIAGWDNLILTESFALSGTVIFIYLVLKYITKPCFLYGILSIILVFFLTFLRPTFLVFDILLFGFWILRMFFEKKERILLAMLSLCSSIVFLFIGIYSSIFYRTHGIFSISDPVPRQLLIVCINRDYYKSSDNKDLIDIIEEGKRKYDGEQAWNWYTLADIMVKYSNKEIMELSKECIRRNIRLYIRDTIKMMSDDSYKIFDAYHGHIKYEKNIKFSWFLFYNATKILENMFNWVKVAHVYLVIVLELIALLICWIKRKSPPWVHMGIFSFVLSIVVTSYVGTCDEYPRTMTCVLPFMYLSLVIGIDWFLRNSYIKRGVNESYKDNKDM